MKLKKLFTFLIASLLLGSCSGGKNSSTVISSVQESSVSSVERESSLVSSSIEEQSSFSSRQESLLQWSDEISAKMMSTLCYVLPYVDLGENISSEEKKEQYRPSMRELFLMGEREVTNSFIHEVETVFVDDGFVLLNTDDSEYEVIASKQECHLTVSFGFSDEGCLLSSVYEEPFDTDSKTSYTRDEMNQISSHLHGHGIPFVYLGAENPYIEYRHEYIGVRIYGGVFNDQVYALAKAALNSYSMTEGYSKPKKSNFSGKTIFATTSFDDGCELFITVGKDYSNNSLMSVQIKEAYSDEEYSYSDNILVEMDDYLAGHSDDIPSLALGGEEVESEYDDHHFTYSLYGGYEDEKVFEAAKELFAQKSYTIIEEKENYLTATALPTDGCNLSFLVSVDDYGRNYFSITIEEKYDPYRVHSFPDALYDAADLKWNVSSLPYVYLGTSYPYYDELSSYQVKDNSTLQVTGGKYRVAIIVQAEDTLKNAGFTVTHEKRGCASYSLKADLKEDDGYTLTYLVYENYDARAQLRIFYDETYDETSVSEWSQDFLDYFQSDLDNHILPFTYLGRKEPDHYYASYYSTFVIIGGTYVSNMTDNVYAAYYKEGFEVDKTTVSKRGNYTLGSTIVKASKKFSDHHILEMTFGPSSSIYYLDRAFLTVSIREEYNLADLKNYDEEIKTELTDPIFDGHSLPSLYLLSDDLSLDYDSSNRLILTGGYFESRLIEDNSLILESNGFSCYTFNETSSLFVYRSTFLYARKKYDDGCLSQILLGMDKFDYRVHLIYWIEDSMDEGKLSSDYSSSLRNKLDLYSPDVSVPYLYLNSDNITNHLSQNQLVGGLVSSDPFFYDYLLLSKDGYVVSYVPTARYKLKAYKKDDATGKIIFLTLSSQNGNMLLSIEINDGFERNYRKVDYDDDIKEKMDVFLHNHSIPYLQLGSSPTFTYANEEPMVNTLAFESELFDPYVLEYAKTELSDLGYDVKEDYDYYGKTIVASTSFSDGCQLLITLGRNSGNGCLLLFTLYKR